MTQVWEVTRSVGNGFAVLQTVEGGELLRISASGQAKLVHYELLEMARGPYLTPPSLEAVRRGPPWVHQERDAELERRHKVRHWCEWHRWNRSHSTMECVEHFRSAGRSDITRTRSVQVEPTSLLLANCQAV